MADKMSKEQCLEELHRLEEDVPPSWSLPEIRGYLIQKWLEIGHRLAKGIVKEDGSSYASLKRGQAEVLCYESKFPVHEGDVRSSLIYKPMLDDRGWLDQPSTGQDFLLIYQWMQEDRMNQPSAGKDFLGFGEFGSRTYEDVQEMEPHYCLWVRETMNNIESSEDVQRFGR